MLGLAPFAFSDAPLDRGMQRQYTAEVNAAWPGLVNIYLAGGNFSFREPAFSNVRIVGCVQIAGALYYVLDVPGRPSAFIPQSQVLVIANLAGK